MKHKSLLILIAGLPATGKTTLSQVIASQLSLPLVSKDAIKEILFDDVGHVSREWGEKLNAPTYSLLNYFVESSLKSGQSLVVEAPYDNDFPRATYEKWQREYGFECAQVLCFADTDVLIDRFVARIGSPDRHPGHNDKEALDDFKKSIKGAGKVQPIALEGEVYEIDTTDFSGIDSDKLLRQLTEQMALVHKTHPGFRLLKKFWG